MRLILIRHAESHHSRDGIIAELSGCRGLTERGFAQVQLLAQHLRSGIDLHDQPILLSSPALRARQTAESLAGSLDNVPVEFIYDLCEVHPGVADGLTVEAYRSTYGAFDLVTSPTRPFAPGGESWEQFLNRVQAMLDRLAIQYAGRTVVAVTHAGFIVASFLVLFAIPRPGNGARIDPKHTSITEWHYFDHVWHLLRYNDLNHLGRLVE